MVHQFSSVLAATLALLAGCTSPEVIGLSESETSELHEEIDAMTSGFESGDVDLLLENTHEAVYPLAGGKEPYEQGVRDAVEFLREENVVFLESETRAPSPLYPAGDEEICFVPRVSVYEVNGRKIQSNGYMVCIRPRGGGEWRYVDGAGFQQKPGRLWDLFPELPREATPPGIWRQEVQ